MLVSLSVCVLGAAHARIFAQPVWDSTGLDRFLTWSGLFAAAASVLFLVRRTLLLPCLFGGAVLYAAVLTGPRPVCALAFFLLAAYGLGRWLLAALGLIPGAGNSSGLLHTLALVAGCAIWGWLAGLLAFSRWNVTPVFVILLAGPAAVACRELYRRWKALVPLSADLTRHLADYGALALLLYTLGTQFLMSLKPEVSADGIAVHLAVPLYMLQHHAWHFDVTRVSWGVMAMAGDWCFTTLVFLGGEFAAKLLPFAFLVIDSLLVFHLCRTQTSRNPALVIASVFAATPVIQLTTGAMFTDNLWTAFLLSAAIALIEATRRPDPRYVPLCGALLGAALATKLVALAFVLPCLVWIVAASGGQAAHRRHQLLTALRAMALVALLAAPPLVTGYWKTGNPVFPFLNSIFRSPYFATSSSWEDVRFKTPLSWHVPFDLTFHTSRFLESRDGALGLAYLFALLLLFSAPRSLFTREMVGAMALAAAFFGATWATASYVRYVVPALPLLLYAFARYLQLVRGGDASLFGALTGITVAMVAAGMYLLPASGYWHKDFCLNPMNFRAEAAAYLELHAPSRLLAEHLNRTAPEEPVAFFTNGIAGLNARAYSTGLHNFTFYRECLAARSGAEVNALMARTGIRHFVTPLPRCGSPPLPALAEFLARYTHERFRAGCLYIADRNADP